MFFQNEINAGDFTTFCNCCRMFEDNVKMLESPVESGLSFHEGDRPRPRTRPRKPIYTADRLPSQNPDLVPTIMMGHSILDRCQ